jgi:hypothetical protein
MVRPNVVCLSSRKSDFNNCNSVLSPLSFVYKVVSEDKILYIFMLVCFWTFDCLNFALMRPVTFKRVINFDVFFPFTIL